MARSAAKLYTELAFNCSPIWGDKLSTCMEQITNIFFFFFFFKLS